MLGFSSEETNPECDEEGHLIPLEPGGNPTDPQVSPLNSTQYDERVMAALGGVNRTRPLFPYPQVGRYKGTRGHR